MRHYGLYVDLLPTNEASLLRSIIRLSSDLGGRWRVTDNASDCDVMMLDGDTDNTLLDAPDNALTLVTSREWRDNPDTPFLGRPFRADSIIAVLGLLEAKLARKPSVPSSGRAKLRRWPAEHVAGGSSSALRMATVLSRAACSAPELAKRLSLPQETCGEFISLLERDGFLTWESSNAPPVGEQAVTPAATAIGAGWKLLGAIRRRLGISLSGA